MELRQLEYFLMVSEVNSFTRAAERLYVSQPAVTNAIRSLEDELGILLFDRAQKQALLTSEGRVFYQHIKNVMHGVSQTISEINELKNLNSGILTLGLTPLAGTYPIPQLLVKFQQTYPNIKFTFVEDNVSALQKKLIEDKLDLAIVFDGARNNSLEYTPLARQELVICCSRDHAFKRKNSLELAQLVNEPLILSQQDCLFRRQIVAEFEKLNTLPQIAFESGHVQTIKSLVASGLGISILPRDLCENDSSLAVIDLEEPLYADIVLAHKAGHHLSHAAQALSDIIQKGHDAL